MAQDGKSISEIFNAATGRKGTADEVTLRPLASQGLTHDHYVIGDTGLLLRVPRRNQLDMTPEDYLAHQKACYDAAEASGATPALRGLLPPSKDLPNGAMIIDYIESRRPETPEDKQAMAVCMGALNALPLPENSKVQAASAPFESQWFLLDTLFGHYLTGDKIDPAAQKLLLAEKAALREKMDALAARADELPQGLIGADSHAGNFIIDGDGKAWFVDLEFLTADVPQLDAADAASPLTSRLDPTNKAVFSAAEKKEFYKTWSKQSGYDRLPENDALLALSERMVNMRTLAWLCYWVQDGRAEQKCSEEARANWDRMADEYLSAPALEKLFTQKSPQSTQEKQDKPRPPGL
ncbi:MAG: phosphotransferase [Alphaproteobacteria bacterium]|nr:phosphotransferase [Alphaproteobacteria bacterium]